VRKTQLKIEQAASWEQSSAESWGYFVVSRLARLLLKRDETMHV
jgi:hypothetical protein